MANSNNKTEQNKTATVKVGDKVKVLECGQIGTVKCIFDDGVMEVNVWDKENSYSLCNRTYNKYYVELFEIEL